MIVVIAHLPAKTEHRADLLAALAPLPAQTRAEPGCLSYAFHSDINDEDLFVSVETWTDRASLDTHLGVVGPALEGILPMLSGAPSIVSYEVSSETKLV